MVIFIAFIMGFIAACVLVPIIHGIRTVGTLVIAPMDWMDGPYIFLELSRSVNILAKSKYVTLKTRVESFEAQE